MSDLQSHSDLQAIPKADPAATVILLRPREESFEVLLLLRAKAVKFAGGSWVFPGGRIDPADYQGIPDNEEQAARVAAARESHEEAGLQLNPRDFGFFSHWTTPIVEKKRFSTWFLWGHLEEDQKITVDDSEIVDYLWVKPADALHRMQQKRLKIMPPTYLTLLELSRCNTIAAVAQLTQSRPLPTYFPNLILDCETPGILLEGDAGYTSGEMEREGIKQRVILGPTGWQYIAD